jgi:hypothetical protein
MAMTYLCSTRIKRKRWTCNKANTSSSSFPPEKKLYTQSHTTTDGDQLLLIMHWPNDLTASDGTFIWPCIAQTSSHSARPQNLRIFIQCKYDNKKQPSKLIRQKFNVRQRTTYTSVTNREPAARTSSSLHRARHDNIQQSSVPRHVKSLNNGISYYSNCKGIRNKHTSGILSTPMQATGRNEKNFSPELTRSRSPFHN